jgi:serine/threonine protein kinase
MEFVEGGTLHEFIQTSPQMSEPTVRHIIRQILSALEYMHDHRRVSHRDLKPAVSSFDDNTHDRIFFFATEEHFQL